MEKTVIPTQTGPQKLETHDGDGPSLQLDIYFLRHLESSECLVDSLVVLLLQPLNRSLHVHNISLGSLDRRASISLPLPSVDVALELRVLALLLFDVLTDLAPVFFERGLVHQLHAAGLALSTLHISMTCPSPRHTSDNEPFDIPSGTAA